MVYPKDNLLKALAHDRPYWLPCPMFDKSVIVVSHGLKEHCLEGEDA